MAQFDKVTYDEYSETLGRSIIPAADEFNKFKLDNIQEMKRLLPYLEETEEDGIDKAVCMMIEVDYIDQQTQNGENDAAVASESLGGHSVSTASTARTKLEELNAKSTAARKMDRIKWFCLVKPGVM